MTIRLDRSALRIPYLAVRTPLGLLDDQVVVRVFGAESSAHRVLARGLEQLDTLAASALGPESGPSGRNPSPKPAAPTAQPMGPTPTPTMQSSAPPAPESPPGAPDSDTSTTSSPDAGQALPAEEQDEIEQLAEVFVAEEALAPRAGELAENDELRRVQAEIRAKQAVEDDRGQL